MKTRLSLTVNGESHDVLVPVHKTLLEVLREDLGLIGTKHGCELGECGTCTVLVDGEPVLSCLALPADLRGRGHHHRRGHGAAAASCTRCSRRSPSWAPRSAATARPASSSPPRRCCRTSPSPTRQRIREALAGNLCRCTGYTKILDAVELAALRMSRRREARA